MMPQSAQNLYFHLGMNADDDGFCEHFAIMRMTASNPDDLSVLIVKGFVHAFDEKVLVILDWKENNYLRSDRYTPSNYLETYKEDLLSLEEKGKQTLLFGIPDGRQSATQDRIGKDRIGNRDDVKISGSEQLVDIPKWIDPNVWEEWCQYRKQIKKKLTPLSAKKQIEYRNWRRKVFERDNFECQNCSQKRGKYITAHHIKSWAKYPKLRYNISNGVTLCEICHSRTDNYKGRANKKLQLK